MSWIKSCKEIEGNEAGRRSCKAKFTAANTREWVSSGFFSSELWEWKLSMDDQGKGCDEGGGGGRMTCQIPPSQLRNFPYPPPSRSLPLPLFLAFSNPRSKRLFSFARKIAPNRREMSRHGKASLFINIYCSLDYAANVAQATN